MKHTPLPWITDDRHIHPDNGRLTYPRGQEPETDVIVQVDTDLHENALLNETDKANLALIVRAVNTIDEVTKQRDALLAACKRLLVGVTHQSRTNCEWYKGIEWDAADEAEAAIRLCEKGGVKS